VALGASLWGADTPLRRPLTASLSSSHIVLIEHVILTAVLLPVCWRRRQDWLTLRPAQWAAILGIAWGGSALGTVCFTEAIKIGNPTTAVFLQKMQPLFAVALARALLHESLGRRFWLLLAAAVGAGYLVSFGDQLNVSLLAGERAPAALLALAAAALWGASTVLGRFALRSLPFLTLTALRLVTATPLLLALAWKAPGGLLRPLTGGQVASLLLMALLPGLAALLIYYRGLSQALASRAALAELAYPATATVLNWALLDARVTAAQLAGFALLWLAILNLERGNE
jgi:drug/metabolite transporter (DMT)-like permease